MLISLHIENIAVIRCVDLELSEGFTVLTGQTGAGKSMLIDAINLLIGAKAQKDLIRAGTDCARVSGVFGDLAKKTQEELCDLGVEVDEDGVLMIERTLDTEGKSKVRCNGRIIPLSVLRQIGPWLLDIHGQHDNQKLLCPSSHIEVLDGYANNGETLKEYRKVYDEMSRIRKEISRLACDEMEKAREIEMLKYQINDIDAVSPQQGEDEKLEASRRRIKDGEKIRKNADLVSRALYRSDKGLSASEILAKAATAMETLAPYLDGAKEYAERLMEYRYEIADMGQAAAALLTDADEGEDQLDRIEERLHELSKLKRKYGTDLSSVLQFREKAKERLDSIQNADRLVEEKKQEYLALKKQALAIGQVLSKSREEAASRLESTVLSELSYLDMPKVRFHISVKPAGNEEKKAFLANGLDEVEFLISANPGEPLKPLDRIASGGELSRVMLALKSACASQAGETMIFDEIDTGISGKTSQKIGLRLRRLGEGAQVLCITHSAQIAAVAHTQMLISKKEVDDRVETDLTVLDREARVMEIARIMGGEQMTDNLMHAASELLSEYN